MAAKYLTLNKTTLKFAIAEVSDDKNDQVCSLADLRAVFLDSISRDEPIGDALSEVLEFVFEKTPFFHVYDKAIRANREGFDQKKNFRALDFSGLPKVRFFDEKNLSLFSRDITALEYEKRSAYRLIHSLKEREIEFVWELALFNVRDLLEVKNFYHKSLNNLKETFVRTFGENYGQLFTELAAHFNKILDLNCMDIIEVRNIKEFDLIMSIIKPGHKLSLRDIYGFKDYKNFPPLRTETPENIQNLIKNIMAVKSHIRHLLGGTLKP